MNRSRLPIVAALIISLIAAGLTREWASAERNRGVGGVQHSTNSAAQLSRMNSYALALLLGGLRGPLVMFLWPSAEQQKSEKNLEDFDTKIEWIRLLQAEFDTVHIFQIWNKAYNISVQKANLANKYATILDALDYAHNVDAERPNDINILYAMGQVYFEKLGSSTESAYYKERVREETQARDDMIRITLPAERRAELVFQAADLGVNEARLHFASDPTSRTVWVNLPKSVTDKLSEKFNGPGVLYTPRPRTNVDRKDPGWRRTELDAMLDPAGYILPQYLTPTVSTPITDPDTQGNDGSELQYLKKYQPFPYGISTLGLGYNYYKRSEILETVNKQKHAQLSEVVIDSRPAVSLKGWSEDEWARGRNTELQAFGEQIPSDDTAKETPTAAVKLDATIAHPALLNESLDAYRLVVRLVGDSLKEYDRHLSHHKTNLGNYLTHMDDLRAERNLVTGDLNYLLAMLHPDQRAESVKLSAEAYRNAIHDYELILLQNYVPDDVAIRIFPKGTTKANLREKNQAKEMTDEQVDQLFSQVLPALPPIRDLSDPDSVNQYFSYLARAHARLDNLK